MRLTGGIVCGVLLGCVHCSDGDSTHVFGRDIESDRPALEPIFGEAFESSWYCAVASGDISDYYMQRVDDAMRASCDSGYPDERAGYLHCIGSYHVHRIWGHEFCYWIAECAQDLPRRYRVFQCVAWAAEYLHDCFESADTPSARTGCDIDALELSRECSAPVIRTITQEERDLWRRTCDATGEEWE